MPAPGSWAPRDLVVNGARPSDEMARFLSDNSVSLSACLTCLSETEKMISLVSTTLTQINCQPPGAMAAELTVTSNEQISQRGPEQCAHNGKSIMVNGEPEEHSKTMSSDAHCLHRSGSMSSEHVANFRTEAEKHREAEIREELGDQLTESAISLKPLSAIEVKSRIDRFILSPMCEYFISGTILLNMFFIISSLQIRGLTSGAKIGLRDGNHGLQDAERFFEYSEYVFNGVYILELVLRICVLGKAYVKDSSNIMDFFIVIISAVDCFLLPFFDTSSSANVVALRFARVTRILKVAKFLRFSQTFSELRIAIRTLRYAASNVIWGVALLLGIILMGTVIMTEMANVYLEDETFSLEERAVVYECFGTAFASGYTMLESTFTGRWGVYARPLIQEVSYTFAVFWTIWIVFVNFVVMRIISALFIKSTLAVGALDEEKMAMEQAKERGQICNRIRGMFQLMDTSGDGLLSKEEFEEMMAQASVVEQFAELGLDTDQLHALFNVLSSDDGFAHYEAFVAGALAMSSRAMQSIDVVKSQQLQMKIAADVRLILEHLGMEHLGPTLGAAPTEPKTTMP